MTVLAVALYGFNAQLGLFLSILINAGLIYCINSYASQGVEKYTPYNSMFRTIAINNIVFSFLAALLLPVFVTHKSDVYLVLLGPIVYESIKIFVLALFCAYISMLVRTFFNSFVFSSYRHYVLTRSAKNGSPKFLKFAIAFVVIAFSIALLFFLVLFQSSGQYISPKIDEGLETMFHEKVVFFKLSVMTAPVAATCALFQLVSVISVPIFATITKRAHFRRFESILVYKETKAIYEAMQAVTVLAFVMNISIYSFITLFVSQEWGTGYWSIPYLVPTLYFSTLSPLIIFINIRVYRVHARIGFTRLFIFFGLAALESQQDEGNTASTDYTTDTDLIRY